MSGNSGILLYNHSDNTFTQIYSTSSFWKYYKQVTDTKWLISSTSLFTGLLLYNSEDDSIVKINSNGSSWSHYKQVTDTKWLISSKSASSDGSNGVLICNTENNSCTRPLNSGIDYDIFTPDTDNNYYISCSDKTKTPQTLYYTESTDKITLVGYYLEV